MWNCVSGSDFLEYNSWVSSGEEIWNFFPRQKIENSPPVSPPRSKISPVLVDVIPVEEVEAMEEKPMVITHPGVEEEVEAMEEKPDPAPSTPLPPASPANSSAENEDAEDEDAEDEDAEDEDAQVAVFWNRNYFLPVSSIIKQK
jgi:hypothetical protein